MNTATNCCLIDGLESVYYPSKIFSIDWGDNHLVQQTPSCRERFGLFHIWGTHEPSSCQRICCKWSLFFFRYKNTFQKSVIARKTKSLSSLWAAKSSSRSTWRTSTLALTKMSNNLAPKIWLERSFIMWVKLRKS